MSSDKQKRPSARPSVRPSARPSAPPPAATPAKAESPAKPEAATPAETRPSTPPPAADLKPKQARVSARRGAAPTAVDPKPETPSVPPPAPAKESASKPKAAPASARKSAANKSPTKQQPAHSEQPSLPREPEKPAVGEPARPSISDDDVFSAPEADAPVLSQLVQLDEPRESAPSRLALGSGADKHVQEAEEKGAQSLLSSDYYVRQYGAHGMRSLSAEVDDYGLDPHVEERARPYLEALCTRYFRLDLEGAQRVPAEGRALLVANRSGAVPWDGLMLRTALRMQRPELQPLRWLSEDSVIHYPFLGTFMNRLGAVRACPENAERMLSQDRLLAVFPEGAHGSRKLFKERYRLQRFGRGGYVKLALKLGAPILPTAIIGAEETNPLLGRLALFGRNLGPITPTFPWLGPAGLLPAPVKWRVIIGEPVDLSGYGPDAAEDSLVVHRLNEQIRTILQTLVDQAHASRRSVLFG